MQGQAHHFIRYAPEGQAYPVERYRNETLRLLHVLNGRLAEADYLAEEYSIADIAAWPWTRAIRAIGLTLDDYPAAANGLPRAARAPRLTAGTTAKTAATRTAEETAEIPAPMRTSVCRLRLKKKTKHIDMY